MGRVNLRCTSCGFHLSVTDAQLAKPEGVKCPSCMAPVGIDGPVAGGPAKKTARVLASAPDPAPNVKLWIGIGAGVLVVIVVAAVVILAGSSPPPEPEETPKPKQAISTLPKPKAATAPAARTATSPRRDAPLPVEPLEPRPASEGPVPTFVPPAPVSAARPVQDGAPLLPADLVHELQQDLQALKEWHRNLAMTPPEKGKVDAILSAGRGGAEDVEFLRTVAAGPRLRAVKEEASMIRESRERLEKEALEGLPVDKVTMNDGLVLHGRILEETDTVVRLERRLAGGLGEQGLQKAAVKSVEKGKGVGGEFKTRWEGARKGGPAPLVGLLQWCRENALSLQASLAAYAVLVDDPGRAEARKEAGLADDPVARMLEAERQGGFITYNGRRWIPTELKEKLLRDGNALVDGRWMSPKPRIISVASLFRDNRQVHISGTVCSEESVTFSTTQGQEKFDVTEKRRFYSAAPMTVTRARRKIEGNAEADQYVYDDQGFPRPGEAMRGEVTITVPLDAPVLEASVITTAEVRSGGKITVYAIVDGRRVAVYDCDSRESKSHKLPEGIRGRTEVQLIAEITGRATYGKKTDKRRVKSGKRDSDRVIERGVEVTWNQLIPEYPAILFPSNVNTSEVFRLTATTAEPAPGLDKLFEKAQDILKK